MFSPLGQLANLRILNTLEQEQIFGNIKQHFSFSTDHMF